MADLKPPQRGPAVTADVLTPPFMTAVIAAIVVAAIYLARPILMPLALAILMSFALAPLVGLLKRFRLGNVAPVLISLAFAIVILSSLGMFMGSQLARLAAELPHYQTNLSHKIQSVVGSAMHNGTIERLNRTVESLARQLSEPCPECSGRGSIKTTETVTYEIFREITRAVRQFEAARLLVIASPKVVARITDEESTAVAELEEFLGKSIRFQADDQYLQEQFDVVLL